MADVWAVGGSCRRSGRTDAADGRASGLSGTREAGNRRVVCDSTEPRARRAGAMFLRPQVASLPRPWCRAMGFRGARRPAKSGRLGVVRSMGPPGLECGALRRGGHGEDPSGDTPPRSWPSPSHVTAHRDQGREGASQKKCRRSGVCVCVPRGQTCAFSDVCATGGVINRIAEM